MGDTTLLGYISQHHCFLSISVVTLVSIKLVRIVNIGTDAGTAWIKP